MSEYQIRSTSPLRQRSQQRSQSPSIGSNFNASQKFKNHNQSYMSKEDPVTDSKKDHNSMVLRRAPSATSETKKKVTKETTKVAAEGEFTEVFSWGNDKNGQLGLGQRLSQGKQMHPVPRFCSYNIPINIVSCGQAHSVFITTTSLVYSMGSNSSGQLGINDPYTQQKYSPVLIEVLLEKGPVDVKCGDVHSMVLCRSGDVFSWGSNDYGQCGGGNTGSGSMAVVFSPRLVNFESYYRPNIQQIDAGAEHSAFIDDIGRLFMCGRSNHGQLGLGFYSDEPAPIYVNKIPDKINSVACGQTHTVALTMKGEIYVMGSNTQGQLGTGPPSKGSPVPIFLEELSFSRISKIRAGAFSAALSMDQQLFVWGRGIFGEFYTPHRVKSVNKLDILDFQISKGGSAFILTRQGTLYSWGLNDYGQLGHSDYKERATPERIDSLDGKRVSAIALGHEFVIALGLTMASKEYEKIAMQNSAGILKQNPSSASTKQSTKRGGSRQSMRRAKSKTLIKNQSDFTQMAGYSTSKISFKDAKRRQDCCPGETDKLKDVKVERPFENLGGPPAVIKPQRQKSQKSLRKSASKKLSSVPAAQKVYRKTFDSTVSNRSPLRSSRAQSKKLKRNQSSASAGAISINRDRRDSEASRSRSARKEQAPIIISRDEQFQYKAPSSIHETVVLTLRKEKENLTASLANQREATQSLGQKVQQMDSRMRDLEDQNQQMALIQNEDKRALLQLDDNYMGALNEIEILKKRLNETEIDLHKARQSENHAFDEADAAQNDARNYREDLSFLTKETDRLNNEIRDLKADRVEIEDMLRRTQIEFQDYRDSENVRYESIQIELKQLRQIKELNLREIDSLREQLDETQMKNRELRQTLDGRVGDQSVVSRQLDVLHSKNQTLSDENNNLRFQVRDLADKNQDLELRLNRSLVDRSVAFERQQAQERVKNVIHHNETVVSRERDFAIQQSRERSRSKDASSYLNKSNGYSPLRPQAASPSPMRPQAISPIDNGNSVVYEQLRPVGVSPIEYGGNSSVAYDRNSPLRRSSSPNERRSPPRIGGLVEDNQARMRKSQERIAAILGMDNKARGPHQQSIQELLNQRRDHGEASSGYVNLRNSSPLKESKSRSPLRHSAVEQVRPENPKFASSMVKQSLADLKDRLDVMRREKQQVYRELDGQ